MRIYYFCCFYCFINHRHRHRHCVWEWCLIFTYPVKQNGHHHFSIAVVFARHWFHQTCFLVVSCFSLVPFFNIPTPIYQKYSSSSQSLTQSSVECIRTKKKNRCRNTNFFNYIQFSKKHPQKSPLHLSFTLFYFFLVLSIQFNFPLSAWQREIWFSSPSQFSFSIYFVLSFKPSSFWRRWWWRQQRRQCKLWNTLALKRMKEQRKKKSRN